MPSWNNGWPNWNPAPADPALFNSALVDPSLIAGIAAYRRHPYQRDLPDPAVIWQDDASRLLDYGVPESGDAPAMLFVPSLINRAYVLDLMRNHSCLRWLAARGVRPLLLDWGWPDESDRQLTLTDLVAGRLERAMMAVGKPLVLAGYCMGGLLALAAALRRPDLLRGLALLATPWDFHAPHPASALQLAGALPALEPILQTTGAVPVDLLQTWFAGTETAGIARKYRAFGKIDQASDRARLFVAVEDWLNDGVPLPAPIARECLGGWYGANLPARGEWRVAGMAVRPESLICPSFVAIPARDRLVPPASALALAAALPNAHCHRPAHGHVGMVAGPSAEAALWQPMLTWLQSLPI